MRQRKELTRKGKQTLKRYREQRNYDGMREFVIFLYHNECAGCGKHFESSKLTVHHKDRKGRGSVVKNNDETNLEPMCRSCHAKEHMDELIAARQKAYGGRWSRRHECCVGCGTTTIKHNGNGLCKTCSSKRERTLPKTPKTVWSTKHDACAQCGSTASPHKARGVCATCYNRDDMRKRRSNGKDIV